MERNRFCIVSDLDHTMVDHSDPAFPTLLEFNRLWLSKFAHDSYLVFSTGRSLESYTGLRKETPLLTPDLLICSVGTEIYNKMNGELQLDSEWLAKLDEGWDRSKIVAVAATLDKLTPQGDSEQRPHKVSYHLNQEGIDSNEYIGNLREKLRADGLNVKVIYSGGVDVDVLPACASKGLALQFLQSRWERNGCLPLDGIQVNGDSGNDSELFEAPGVYGCIVSNAMEELVQWAKAHPSERILMATRRCTAGIMETMYHFGKVPDDSALPALARAFKTVVTLYTALSLWRNKASPDDTDALRKELDSRLRGTCGASVDPKLEAFVRDPAAMLGTAASPSGEASEILWLDRISGQEAPNGTWLVSYVVCTARIGGQREHELRCEAVVQACGDAPEGFVVAGSS